MSEKPKYMRVRAYLKEFLINRGPNNRTPIRSILGLIEDKFEVSERQATMYVSSFIDMFCEPPTSREFEYYVPYVRGTDWGMKQGYLFWKGKDEN